MSWTKPIVIITVPHAKCSLPWFSDQHTCDYAAEFLALPLYYRLKEYQKEGLIELVKLFIPPVSRTVCDVNRSECMEPQIQQEWWSKIFKAINGVADKNRVFVFDFHSFETPDAFDSFDVTVLSTPVQEKDNIWFLSEAIDFTDQLIQRTNNYYDLIGFGSVLNIGLLPGEGNAITEELINQGYKNVFLIEFAEYLTIQQARVLVQVFIDIVLSNKLD